MQPIMHLWQAIVEGIVQGLTEFLPVSSSAHLVFADHFLHLRLSPDDTVFFDVMLHLGTLVAVLAYFYRDILAMLAGAGQLLVHPRRAWRDNANSRLFVLLLLGTVPAALAGKTLKPFFESAFQNVPGTAAFLLVTAVMLFYITRKRVGERTVARATWKDALLIGLFQAIAILPGISRSGATITAGFLRGFDRDAAPRFSFLLSIPIILGGGLLAFKDVLDAGSTMLTKPLLIAGFAASAISGYLAIVLLLGVVRKGRLDRFGYYCAVVGVLMLGYWVLLVPKIDIDSTVAVASATDVYHYQAGSASFGPIEMSKNITFEVPVTSGLVPVSTVYAVMPPSDHAAFVDATPPKFVWKAGEKRFYIENYKLLPLGHAYEPDAAGEWREIWVIARNRWGIQNEVRLRVRIVPESLPQRMASL